MGFLSVIRRAVAKDDWQSRAIVTRDIATKRIVCVFRPRSAEHLDNFLGIYKTSFEHAVVPRSVGLANVDAIADGLPWVRAAPLPGLISDSR